MKDGWVQLNTEHGNGIKPDLWFQRCSRPTRSRAFTVLLSRGRGRAEYGLLYSTSRLLKLIFGRIGQGVQIFSREHMGSAVVVKKSECVSREWSLCAGAFLKFYAIWATRQPLPSMGLFPEHALKRRQFIFSLPLQQESVGLIIRHTLARMAIPGPPDHRGLPS